MPEPRPLKVLLSSSGGGHAPLSVNGHGHMNETSISAPNHCNQPAPPLPQLPSLHPTSPPSPPLHPATAPPHYNCTPPSPHPTSALGREVESPVRSGPRWCWPMCIRAHKAQCIMLPVGSCLRRRICCSVPHGKESGERRKEGEGARKGRGGSELQLLMQHTKEIGAKEERYGEREPQREKTKESKHREGEGGKGCFTC